VVRIVPGLALSPAAPRQSAPRPCPRTSLARRECPHREQAERGNQRGRVAATRADKTQTHSRTDPPHHSNPAGTYVPSALSLPPRSLTPVTTVPSKAQRHPVHQIGQASGGWQLLPLRVRHWLRHVDKLRSQRLLERVEREVNDVHEQPGLVRRRHGRMDVNGPHADRHGWVQQGVLRGGSIVDGLVQHRHKVQGDQLPAAGDARVPVQR
jgi:hypothetical protein